MSTNYIINIRGNESQPFRLKKKFPFLLLKKRSCVSNLSTYLQTSICYYLIFGEHN